MTITLEALEQLASQIEATEAAEREKLSRLIRAYSRILAVREPQRFKRTPLEYHDDPDDNGNGSYPPSQTFANHNGPTLLTVMAGDTDYVADSGDFYHDCHVVTDNLGLYVDRKGDIYTRTAEGSARYGQFPAHPGYCDVEIRFTYDDTVSPGKNELQIVERKLRALAFPHVQEVA